MADTSSPFGNVADLWGEPVALRAQRQAHDLAAQTTAQTQSREATARADLANVWLSIRATSKPSCWTRGS